MARQANNNNHPVDTDCSSIETVIVPALRQWLFKHWDSDCSSIETVIVQALRQWLFKHWDSDCSSIETVIVSSIETVIVQALRQWLFKHWDSDCSSIETVIVQALRQWLSKTNCGGLLMSYAWMTVNWSNGSCIRSSRKNALMADKQNGTNRSSNAA